MAEFIRAGGLFDQFKEMLQDHQKQAQDWMTWVTQEEEALVHDRGIFPWPGFSISNAKMLLCGDMADRKHLTRGNGISGSR
jgi:hypothetical protein